MKNRSNVIGVFLILFGFLIMFGSYFDADASIVPMIISFPFLFVYFLLGAWSNKASIGFLIPGVIMAMIGIFTFLQHNSLIPDGAQPIFLVILGFGFLIIMFVHTIRIDTVFWGEKYWPAFPGGILIFSGTVALTRSVNQTFYSLISPVVLIGIGIYILFIQVFGGRNENRK